MSVYTPDVCSAIADAIGAQIHHSFRRRRAANGHTLALQAAEIVAIRTSSWQPTPVLDTVLHLYV